MTLKSGNVGIGATSPAYKLQVTQSAADWTIHANGTGGYGLLGTGSVYAGYFQGPVYIGGNLGMNNYNITGVNKITLITVDPPYIINGKTYSTYVSAISGGVKEETTGVVELSNSTASNRHYAVIDFRNAAPESDLVAFPADR